MDIRTIERLLGKSSRFNKLKPASENSLNYLQITGYPDSFVEFYRQYEPDKSYDFGDVTLYSTHSIEEENTSCVPGAYIFPLGLIAFASNLYGDTYCFNISSKLPDEPQVFLVPHDDIHEGISSISEVLERSRLAANNFEDFLSRLVDGTLIT